MKERPILMSAPMVRALLAGTKTQTRRVVKPQPDAGLELGWVLPQPNADRSIAYWHESRADGVVLRDVKVSCQYGQPSDRLWVRETFAKIDGQTQPWIETDYRATYKHGARLGDALGLKKRWTPAIHMPRAASRITLEITGVRVARLQEISDADARAEGCEPRQPLTASGIVIPGQWRLGYRNLWNEINGPDAWDANPWVWVVEFTRCS